MVGGAGSGLAASSSTLPPISSAPEATAGSSKPNHSPAFPTANQDYSPADSASDSASSVSSDDGSFAGGDGDGDDGGVTAGGDVMRVANSRAGDGRGDGSHALNPAAPPHPAVAPSAASQVQAGSSSADAKKQRACEACRGLKVRCDMDPNAPPDTPCRRCAKAGRRCIVTQPTRRRQKKTDSRVAELEKKIDALTASLQMTRQTGGGAGTGGITAEADSSAVRAYVGNDSNASGILRNWSSILELPKSVRSTRGAASSTPTGRDLPSAARAGAAGSNGAPTPNSPLSTGTGTRSSFSTGPPPMVMAGQKRKFSEIREATGVVGAGAGGTGSSSRLGSRSSAGPAAGEESPPKRDSPYQSMHAHHGHSMQHYPQLAQKSHLHDAKAHQAQQHQTPPPPPYNMPPTPTGIGSNAQFGPEYADIIDRGLLTMERAVELFQRYTDHMAKHMPAVIFPPGTTAAEVRKSKPVLFLSLMAASTTEMPDVQKAIVKEMMQVFAEKIFISGEKSIELIQALHVAVIWYWPPEHFEELKFYQLVHIAAVMGIDIGLGKRRGGSSSLKNPGSSLGTLANNMSPGRGSGAAAGSRPPGGPFSNWRDHPFKKYPLPDPCSIEGRRTWLASYFLTSNTAMALHRPNLVRWTQFMTECVEVLESSPDAAPTDQYLCHLVWTHRLAEEVGQQFSMDDPTAVINIADPRTQYSLRGFEREMERYKRSISPDLLQPSLRVSFEVLSLYMHEIALQTDNGNDEFKAPYTAESTKEALIGDATLTPAHVRALTACLLAIDGIFDAFLGMDVASLRCIPVFNFVRVAYATVVMIKLYLFASSPNSELGTVINKDQMKVEQHLNALLGKFRAVAEGNRSRPAGKFMIVLAMIRSWFLKQQHQVNTAAEGREGDAQEQQQRNAADPGNPAADRVLTPKPAAVSASPSGTGTPSTMPGGVASAAQPYFPSSTFLSVANSNNNVNNYNTNSNRTSASSPAGVATPSLSVVSGVSVSTPGAANDMQAVSQQPYAPAYSSANTPLQLLSEIAANDYAASAATVSAAIPQQQQGGGVSSASASSIPPWPPFYGGMESGSGGAGGGSAGSVAASAQAGPVPQQPLMPPPPPTAAQSLSSADYLAQYPNLNLGDNYEFALDLTFAGLTEGPAGMDLSDGLHFLLADPWFGGVSSGGFQF